MNKPDDPYAVNWLFVDLNAFFASCEQQEKPDLRGRPVAVVQTETDATCAIAASYEARRFGIKTGTRIGEARQLCPELVTVRADHALYRRYHDRILEAVDTCIPVDRVLSIDEMACRLTGIERRVEAARDLGRRIKQVLRERVGICLTSSIGLAPNLLLAKLASDMEKPDGLVALRRADLPQAIEHLKLQDISGIGPRMEGRLHHAGIRSIEDLWRAPSLQLRQVWGGVRGVLFYELLHGKDVVSPSSSEMKSLGHQHVLEPALRTGQGARSFSRHLLAKAAERLRRHNYFCRKLGLSLSWHGELGGFWNEAGFQETQATDFLLERLHELWRAVPPYKPLRVGVTLLGLVPAQRHQPDLFSRGGRRERLAPLLDRINRRYGSNTIGFGYIPEEVRRFRGHAAFQRVPESWEL